MQALFCCLTHGAVIKLIPTGGVFGKSVVMTGIHAGAVVHYGCVQVEKDAIQAYSIVQVDAL